VAGLQAADPILDAAGLRRAGLAYAGARDPRHPWLSPVNGSLAGLRGLAAFIGGRDIFLPDVRRLADRARAEGVGLDCREYPEMVHVWPFFGLPESRRAIDAIVAMIPAK
jgi:acetyl esterase/lipase